MSAETYLSAVEVASRVKDGDLSPVDLVEACLARIDADENNAFITVVADEARERAREAERAAASGEDLGLLHGVPVALKDLHATKAGVRHTYGAKPFADNVADRDAVVTERLEAEGAVVLGKTNTPEFGHKPRTDNELVGATGTPFDYDRIAGGSSGGSAAALADGLVSLATGSDVGGSLRVPASCCGVVSVKPTFGLIPRDQRPDGFSTHTPVGVLGPRARTVADCALAMEVLVGPDHRDPFSVPRPGADYLGALDRDPSSLDVAYSPDLDRFAVEGDVAETVADAVDALRDVGASVTEVPVGGPAKADLDYAFGRQGGVRFASIARAVREEYGVDVVGEHADQVSDTLVATVKMGGGYDAVEYEQSNLTRTKLYDAVEAALDGYDALVTPAMAVPPFGVDDPDPTEIAGEPANGTLTDWTLSWVFNLTGHPVVTVPAGLTDEGLPVGLQIVTRRYAEDDGLAVAAALESANPWAETYPGLARGR